MRVASLVRNVIGLLVVSSAFVAPAAAEVVLSNLSQSSSSSDPFASYRWRAVSFTTDSNFWSLTSATLRFGDANDWSGSVFVQVWGDAAGKPGSSLATLAGEVNPETAGDYTYTAAGVSLDPSTRYWLVAGVSGTGVYNWMYVNDSGAPVVDGVWSIPAEGTYTSTVNQGGYWSVTGNGYPYMFSLSATAVPEIDPAGMGSVLALVAGALGLFERRRLLAKVA